MGCVWGVLTSEINVATRTVNNAITIKTKVLLTQTYVTLTDIGYPVYTFILFGFPIFRSWAYLMKVIPETYLMKVIPETYLMKVIPKTYLMKVIPETRRPL